MTQALEISRENELFIDEIVDSGRFKSRREAIDEALWLLRNELQQNGSNSADIVSAQDWCERFEAWAASHRRLAHEADDSRESIYAGQGE
jgi:Arc/MetJ-type ribon-helix-helix transcriptional regulator